MRQRPAARSAARPAQRRQRGRGRHDQLVRIMPRGVLLSGRCGAGTWGLSGPVGRTHSARSQSVTAPDPFAEFVSTRYPSLVRYGTLLTGDPGLGEDLAQDALVKTYRAWPRLHPTGNPEAYT